MQFLVAARTAEAEVALQNGLRRARVKADIIHEGLGVALMTGTIRGPLMSAPRMADRVVILGRVVAPQGEVDRAAPNLHSLTKERL